MSYQAEVTGTNMPATPHASSMRTPAPSGTPSLSIEPGFAKRERAVMVPKRPVVIANACRMGWVKDGLREG